MTEADTPDKGGSTETTPPRWRRLVRRHARVVIVVVVLYTTTFWVVRQPTFTSFAWHGETRASAERLRKHVDYLTTEAVPRDPMHPETLEKTAAYIQKAFAAHAPEVWVQEYAAGSKQAKNIIARYSGDGPLLIVGAHYDAYNALPGADDNASGAAGLLELARLLDGVQLTAPVALVAFSTEEPPYFATSLMGSSVHAKFVQEQSEAVRGMICLEMIGYFTDRQPYDNLFLPLFYPWHGNFVAAIGRWGDRGLARALKRGFRGAGGLPLYSYSGPELPGVDYSDHRSYWNAGYTAIMVTDTAYMRNPNYHKASDTADTLDYARMAQVVDGVFNTVVSLQTAGR